MLKFTNKLEHLEIQHERAKGFVSVVAGNSRVNGTTLCRNQVTCFLDHMSVIFLLLIILLLFKFIEDHKICCYKAEASVTLEKPLLRGISY